MFKYLWIVPLVIAYVLAWVYAIADIISVIRDFRFGYWMDSLEDFTVGWLLLHILSIFVCSFLAYVGKL